VLGEGVLFRAKVPSCDGTRGLIERNEWRGSRRIRGSLVTRHDASVAGCRSERKEREALFRDALLEKLRGRASSWKWRAILRDILSSFSAKLPIRGAMSEKSRQFSTFQGRSRCFGSTAESSGDGREQGERKRAGETKRARQKIEGSPRGHGQPRSVT